MIESLQRTKQSA